MILYKRAQHSQSQFVSGIYNFALILSSYPALFLLTIGHTILNSIGKHEHIRRNCDIWQVQVNFLCNSRLVYIDVKSYFFYSLLVVIVVLYTEFSGHLMKLLQNILFKVSSNKCPEQNSLILIQTIKNKTMEKG